MSGGGGGGRVYRSVLYYNVRDTTTTSVQGQLKVIGSRGDEGVENE